MARRKFLTDRMIDALPRTGKRRVLSDSELRSHYLRIPAGAGPITYTVIVKQKGRQDWASIGTTDSMDIETARAAARVAIPRLKAGQPAVEPPPPPPQSVAAVAQSWLERHVHKKGLRSERELRRIVGYYIVPLIGDRDFARLRRTDIVAFLDAVEDKHGPHQADSVLAVLRSVAFWMQTRDDSYVPPFVRGMRRVPTHQQQRSRILSDDELRIVWRAADDSGILGDVIQLLLLTCQRREKIYKLKWSDIVGDVWTVPQDVGQKGVGGRLQLPPVALAIINKQPRSASSDLVFPVRFSTLSKGNFERRYGVSFKLHDLRRTGRTLLSRIGISFEVAEAILGHKARGVAAVYNRDSFEPQKAAALAKLAFTIQQIANPPPANIVPLREVAS